VPPDPAVTEDLEVHNVTNEDLEDIAAQAAIVMLP
jgi:hypothetical protein